MKAWSDGRSIGGSTKMNARAVDRFVGESDDELTGKASERIVRGRVSQNSTLVPPERSRHGHLRPRVLSWRNGRIRLVRRCLAGLQVHHRDQRRRLSARAAQPDIDLRHRDCLAASPDGVLHHFRIWQLLTATFLHADIWHLLGNMWFFWIVGREMESLYGSRDFLIFYLCAAIFSTLAWVLDRCRVEPGLDGRP